MKEIEHLLEEHRKRINSLMINWDTEFETPKNRKEEMHKTFFSVIDKILSCDKGDQNKLIRNVKNSYKTVLKHM